MEAVPENGMILCEQVDPAKNKIETSGLVYEEDRLPTYRILSGTYMSFKPGDIVVCDSTGTKLNLGNGKIRYIFKPENLACRII